jgi:hypothetical protein
LHHDLRLDGADFSRAATAKGISCQPNTTESQSQTVSCNILGGTDLVASAAGTLTGVVTAFTTAAPPGGDGGVLGGEVFSDSGSVTKLICPICRSRALYTPCCLLPLHDPLEGCIRSRYELAEAVGIHNPVGRGGSRPPRRQLSDSLESLE